ncbi:DNA cytosine methyltransferase [Sphingomonas sp. CROZ-RG-20F-R02-07]|uniref:DNA cytosine methyltransferase n=1 Tax=Sphingomonas sp. CROZ-RG-20F-R02-07 TaxID=2914832 RepID=UPI001F55DF67|nr:DNA cytosine methyltransferase [Sphingomonas sp. CROZ-RG-20F-R02-07]
MRGLIIDNFAGGGGASTGIERALGRKVDVAINHDPEAVAMHVANHPDTRHFCQSIMAVDPLDATGGQPVALAWFSPDCKHHSKAKGGKPREKNIRDLAWVVVHWAERLRKATPGGRGAPAVIMLENVEEFRQWGPLDAEGKPIPERKGEEFDLWVRGLKRQGYKVQWRELRACDYGAPTSRKRLFLIARRDGLPIVWPEPTHGKPGSDEVLAGKRLPWRTAAECIDWSIPCPSIFDRKRPLKEATHRRIAHGVMRYVVNAASPFIVPLTHHGERRTLDPADPFPTITAANRGELAEVDAAIVPITHTSNGVTAHSPAEPLRTVTTAKGGELARATVTLAPHVTKFRTGSIGSDAGDPMPTVTANGDSARPAGATPLGIVVGHLEKFSENSRGKAATVPLDAVMAGAPRHAAVTAFLSHFYTSNTNGGQGDPLHPAKTVTSGGQHHAVVCAHMEQANTGRIGHPMAKPVSTITSAGAHQRLVQTTMIAADTLPPEQMERAVQVAAFLVKYYSNEDGGHGLDAPIGTVTTKDRFAVVTVTIDAVTYVIVDIGMRMLTRRELANAQGFPAAYILDPIGPSGKPLSISSSIRMIGNSVCPDMAEALARANVAIEKEAQVAA